MQEEGFIERADAVVMVHLDWEPNDRLKEDQIERMMQLRTRYLLTEIQKECFCRREIFF